MSFSLMPSSFAAEIMSPMYRSEGEVLCFQHIRGAVIHQRNNPRKEFTLVSLVQRFLTLLILSIDFQTLNQIRFYQCCRSGWVGKPRD